MILAVDGDDGAIASLMKPILRGTVFSGHNAVPEGLKRYMYRF